MGRAAGRQPRIAEKHAAAAKIIFGYCVNVGWIDIFAKLAGDL
jgi:hypothetical protein